MAQPSLLQYEAPFQIYGLSFSNSPLNPLRTALTSYAAGPSNKLSVLDTLHPFSSSSSSHAQAQLPSGAPQHFYQQASHGLMFPATKVGWEPAESVVHAGREEEGGRGELLATTGDVLRIWEVGLDWSEERGRGFVGRSNGYNGQGQGQGQGQSQPQGHALSTRSVLTNSKSPAMSLPPITSFSWNPSSPNNIVTCSIDTTATLWDINTSQALTQLIAHDRAVYDLSWLPRSADIFVSVGADGSLRAFDLRTLEHSTILYESSSETPLARIAFSNREQHMLACFGMEDNKVLILDMRSPGHPVAELVGHQGPLNAIAWGSGGDGKGDTGGGYLASCSDDAQLLIYDMTSPLPSSSRPPSTQPTQSKSSQPKQSSLKPNNHTHTILSPSASPNFLPSRDNSPALLPASMRGDGSRSRLSNTTGDDRGGTPDGGANSASAEAAVEIMPARAWAAEGGINNLAFDREGEWLGCVSGNRLNVLRV